jgi:hypothetical protein
MPCSTKTDFEQKVAKEAKFRACFGSRGTGSQFTNHESPITFQLSPFAEWADELNVED